MTRSDLDPEDDGEAPGIVHWQPTRRRRARFREVHIDRLTVGKLTVLER